MICDNVLRYVKVDRDGNIIEVYHKTARNKPVRVTTSDRRYFELEYGESIPCVVQEKADDASS